MEENFLGNRNNKTIFKKFCEQDLILNSEQNNKAI